MHRSVERRRSFASQTALPGELLQVELARFVHSEDALRSKIVNSSGAKPG